MTSNLAILGGPPTVATPLAVDRTQPTAHDVEAVENYLRARGTLSYWTRGGELAAYEDELAGFFSKRHAVLVNSGTSALYLAYAAIGVGPGDEVIVPDVSFYAVATPAAVLGATVVVADCDPNTGLIDQTDVLRRTTSKTKAVTVNHLCGDSDDPWTFLASLHARGVALIEDVSLATGATNNGVRVGSWGDYTCLSLGSTKLLSGGQGGCVLTDSYEGYQRIVLRSSFGGRAQQEIMDPYLRQFADVGTGMNLRMHPLAIAISHARFGRLQQLVAAREERYRKLSSAIPAVPGLSAPRTVPGNTRGSWHGFYALLNADADVSPESLVAAMRAEGMECAVGPHYPRLSRTKSFAPAADDPLRAGDSGSETFVNRVISFPLFLDEPIWLIEQYCRALKKIGSSLGAIPDAKKAAYR